MKQVITIEKESLGIFADNDDGWRCEVCGHKPDKEALRRKIAWADNASFKRLYCGTCGAYYRVRGGRMIFDGRFRR